MPAIVTHYLIWRVYCISQHKTQIESRIPNSWEVYYVILTQSGASSTNIILTNRACIGNDIRVKQRKLTTETCLTSTVV